MCWDGQKNYILLIFFKVHVEQKTALRRNAGDVPVAVLPADIAPRINVPGVKLLGRTVIDTRAAGSGGAVRSYSYYSTLTYRAAALLVRKPPKKKPRLRHSQACRGKLVWDLRVTDRRGVVFPEPTAGGRGLRYEPPLASRRSAH
jgi:hypothetical protein